MIQEFEENFVKNYEGQNCPSNVTIGEIVQKFVKSLSVMDKKAKHIVVADSQTKLLQLVSARVSEKSKALIHYSSFTALKLFKKALHSKFYTNIFIERLPR